MNRFGARTNRLPPVKLGLLAEFLRDPLRTASALPSSRALALAATAPVPATGDPVVVELGPGTGAFTDVVAERGGAIEGFAMMRAFGKGRVIGPLIAEQDVTKYFVLDSVITVIDAVNGVGQFDTHFESVKQAAVADRIVISKTDLVGDGELDSLLARLAEINPSAEIHCAVMGGIEPAKLFGAGTADKDLSRWLVAGAREHEPGHHHNIQTFSVSHNAPIDPAGLHLWLDLLGSYRGPNLLRVKGLLNVAGRPVVVHAVQHLFHQPVALDDWPDEDRSSRIVFITHGIGREDITGTLKALDFKPVGPADGSSMDPQNYARFLSVVKGFENSSG